MTNKVGHPRWGPPFRLGSGPPVLRPLALGQSGALLNSLPGIFEDTLFSRRFALPASLYIRAPHPKTEIRPERSAVERVLSAGWVGQVKIHGHRAQIHISSDPEVSPIVYNRQGKPHQKELSLPIISELRRLFTPARGWNVVDAEWIKSEDKLFVFDFLKKDGVALSRQTYTERYNLLPRNFISPHFQVLPLLTSVEKCLEPLASTDPNIEGVVFKSPTTAGFSDTSVIRCRRKGSPHRQ